MIIAGHSEYWTWDMRQRLKAYIADGGRFINLSGNTMWWQVRFEDDGRTMVGYKDKKIDPETQPEKVTDKTSYFPVSDPEAAILGGHFTTGGFFPRGSFTFENGYGGYMVRNADHWVFAGTDLKEGDMFGRTTSAETAILDKEIDGTSFNCDVDGATILGPLANMGTPNNFTILGVAPGVRKNLAFGVLGIYTNNQGGAAFSTNTTGWVNALASDSQVDRVTQTVLNHFLDTSQPIPAEIDSGVENDYLFYDRFNCHALRDQWAQPENPEWDNMPLVNYFASVKAEDFRLTPACGVHGSGLFMPVTTNTNKFLISQAKPGWEATNGLYTSFFLDLRNLTLAANDTMTILRLYDSEGVEDLTPKMLAQLNISQQNGAVALRYQPAGTDAEWVDVSTDQPILVSTQWNKETNQVSLWLNENRYDQSVDLSTATAPNRVDLGVMDAGKGTSGNICVDEFVFHYAPVERGEDGVPLSGSGSVNGLVYADMNQNGARDADEKGTANVTVTLQSESGDVQLETNDQRAGRIYLWRAYSQAVTQSPSLCRREKYRRRPPKLQVQVASSGKVTVDATGLSAVSLLPFSKF